VERLAVTSILYAYPTTGGGMTEPRIRNRYVCGFSGRLREIWLTIDQLVSLGFGEPFASYGAYVEDAGRRGATATPR
jgi:hypothetical protein